MPDKIATVDQNSFQKIVLQASKPVLVDFWAPWCAPCRAIAPIVEELATEYNGKVEFAKVNVDESPFVASSYGVLSIPTVIVFKDGKPFEQASGFKPKNQFQKMLDNALGKQQK